MTRRGSELLQRLETLLPGHGRRAAGRKLELLQDLEAARLPSAKSVARLHEVLLFLRAYPDDAAQLARIEAMLAAFAARADLRRHARALKNSGIAGTPIHYAFYWFTALWLSQRWPDALTIDWSEVEKADLLDRRLGLLMPQAEGLALDEGALPLAEWVRRLAGPDETDATFLIRRFEALPVEPLLRESYFEELVLPCRLEPGPDTPARTHERWHPAPVFFRRGPLLRSRRSFRPALKRPPQSTRSVPPGAARDLIELARGAMVTRERDLDVFVHADERDVRLLDWGDGLQLVGFGAVPERRQVLDAVYGFLLLRCGVPLGYVLCSALFGSMEVAYNVFPTFRGGEAAHVFGRTLAALRRLFGADTFTLDPYQLGYGNPEGLRSGAWWFYYKLGFRPKDAGTMELARSELRRMRADPGHRSSLATLQELASTNLFLHLGREREDVIGRIARENVGLHVVRHMARRFGSRREQGLRACSRDAARLLGLRSPASLAPGERAAWALWAPLVCVLPGLERWSPAQRSALLRVVRAKGGRRESDFVRLFDAHRPLRRAVLELAASAPEPPANEGD